MEVSDIKKRIGDIKRQMLNLFLQIKVFLFFKELKTRGSAKFRILMNL